ncbi:MAG TPA: IS110 family transposase, partial [Acidobacteriaceae bacterium]
LLIECASHILRPHGRDSALRQWGAASRGERRQAGENKSVVAVARKLTVLLHHLWMTQQLYVPFYRKAA